MTEAAAAFLRAEPVNPRARYDTFMSKSFDEASKSASELAKLVEETVDENSEGK